MSMKPEDYEEFQRQLALQKETSHGEKKLTKKDEDGVEYEWDEDKKAWFPMLSVDQMVQYQSSYNTETENNAPDIAKTPASYMDPLTKTKYVWDDKANQWKPDAASKTYPDNFKYTDPSTGNVYKWDIKSQAWMADGQVVTEPKNEDGAGEGTTSYIHPETNVKYTWDVEEQVWKSAEGEVLLPATEWGNQEIYTDPESGKTFSWDSESQTWKEASGKQKPEKAKKKGKPAQKRAASKAEWFAVEKEKNTSVYVTGLPFDFTPRDFVELMGKCGIIMPNPLTGEPKLKLYLDKIGNPKGDGLCTYLKRESVELAKQLLDDMEVKKGCKIHIQEAEFQLKGEYDATKKPKMMSKKEKKKLQKEQEKMLDWKLNKAEQPISKTDRVVILKNMFDTAEFEEDPVLITDIRDDLRKECEKFGAVKKVLVFDRHSDGVCSVAFQETESALKCQKALNGRWFAGRSVEALIWDGVTNYQIEETDKEREQRIQKWEKYLEQGGKEGESASNSADNPKIADSNNAETTADSKD